MQDVGPGRPAPRERAEERIAAERYIGETGEGAQVSALLGRLGEEIKVLVRAQFEAAKAEVAQQATSTVTGLGMIGVAGILWLGAFGAITLCLISALNLAMDRWVAALIVAVVYGVIAFATMLRGRTKIRQGVPPLR